MTKRRKKKSKKARAPAKPRDPFWRLRRILGQKRTKSPKAYDRAETRKAERAAKDDG